MLRASVPFPSSTASTWTHTPALHLRLHAHAQTKYSVSLTLTIVRKIRQSPLTIHVHVHVQPEDDAVKNVHAGTRINHHRRKSLIMAAADTYGDIRFPPLTRTSTNAPFVLCLQLKLVEPLSHTRPTSHHYQSRSLAIVQHVSHFIDRIFDPSPSAQPISWHEPPSIAPPDALLTNQMAAPSHFSLRSLLKDSGIDGQYACGPPKMFSDFAIISDDENNPKVFHLHSCVLAMASPVFHRMLASQMLESQSRRVTLYGYGTNVLEAAIRFIYGDRVDCYQQPFDLYRFAHQFEILPLLAVIKDTIEDLISITSVVDILLFALFFDDESLVIMSEQFIRHKFDEILSDGNAAKTICRIPPDTFSQLLRSDALHAAEADIFKAALYWLAQQSHRHMHILRDVRWDHLPAEDRDLFESLDVSPLENHPDRFYTTSERSLGIPVTQLVLPTIQPPPRIHKSSIGRSEMDISSVETQFIQSGRRWAFRAYMTGAAHISTSLWICDDLPIKRPFGVSVRVSLCTPGGRVLGNRVNHSVIFRRSGWASGWTFRHAAFSKPHVRLLLHMDSVYEVADVDSVGSAGE